MENIKKFKNIYNNFLNEQEKKYNKIKIKEGSKYEYKEKVYLFRKDHLDIVRMDDDSLFFDIIAPGWWYDTHDVGEGAVLILQSIYKNESKIRDIVITSKDRSKLDEKEALYWLTGGNAVWRFGENDYNVAWKQIDKEIAGKWGKFIKDAVMSSSNLGELMDKFKKFKIEEFYEWMYEQGYVESEDEEEIYETSTTSSAGGNYDGPFAFKKTKKNKLNEEKRLDIDSLFDLIDNNSKIKYSLKNYKLSEEILENSISEISVDSDEDEVGGYYVDFNIKYKEGVTNDVKKNISNFFDNVVSDYISPDYFYDNDDNENEKIFENV